MQCHELAEHLTRWLDGNEPLLGFSADNGQVQVQRLPGGLSLGVALNGRTHDESSLQQALRLGQPSLAHFPGALARDPASGQLWLLQWLGETCDCDTLLNHVEVLLNQRDTWQSMLSEPPTTPPKARPLSLPPGLIGEGIRYA